MKTSRRAAEAAKQAPGLSQGNSPWVLRVLRVLRVSVVLFVLGCDRSPSLPPPAPVRAEAINLQTLAGFDYKERMELPAEVKGWDGKRVQATGFINPTAQARGITQFFLVKDRSSCCFGTRPQINHYVDVTLKDGKSLSYTTDPVTVTGTLRIEDRWDGDWQLGLYWIEDGDLIR